MDELDRMPDRHQIETTYRGQRCVGEWYIEDAVLHVTSSLGSRSGPVATGGKFVSLPSELAQQMLWDLARANDPKRPFFYWR